MTTLSLHDRNRALSPLPAAVVGALVRCFGNHPAASDLDRRSATTILMNLRDAQRWLACGCRGEEIDVLPLMAPRLRDGTIHLFRFGSEPHAKQCPFWVEPTVAAVPGEEGPSAVSTPWTGSWLLLPQRAGSITQPRAATAGEEPPARSRGIPAIARLLFTALTDVGYTTILPGDVVTPHGQQARNKAQDAYAGLDALKERVVAPGLKLRDIGCTYLPALPRLLNQMPVVARRFPSGTRPQGIFIGVVHDVEKVSPTLSRLIRRDAGGKSSAIPVRGTVKMPGYAKAGGGPFWVIAQIAQPAGSDTFEVLNCYAHQALSKSVLLPVDSGMERETAEVLLSQLTYWARPDVLGAAVQLEKPLFPEQLGDGQSCHPDFALHLPNGKRVLVETMGLDKDPEYLATKVRTHALMRALPNVVALVEHHPGDDAKELRKRLTAAVGKAMRIKD